MTEAESNAQIAIEHEPKVEPMETKVDPVKTIFQDILTDTESEDETLEQTPEELDDLGDGVASVPINFFRCKVCCEAAFQTIHDLLRHGFETHSEVRIEQLDDSQPGLPCKVKRFICQICFRQFRAAYLLGSHMDDQNCVPPDTSGTRKKVRPKVYEKLENGSFKCIHCSFVTKTQAWISKHAKYGHFQQVDCFVSRDPSLREVAVEHKTIVEDQRRIHEEKQAQQKSEKREKRRIMLQQRKRRKEEKELKQQKEVEQSILDQLQSDSSCDGSTVGKRHCGQPSPNREKSPSIRSKTAAEPSGFIPQQSESVMG